MYESTLMLVYISRSKLVRSIDSCVDILTEFFVARVTLAETLQPSCCFEVRSMIGLASREQIWLCSNVVSKEGVEFRGLNSRALLLPFQHSRRSASVTPSKGHLHNFPHLFDQVDSTSTAMESEHADTVDETSAFSDAGDREISVIDYARYYGLSKDYTSFYPLSPRIIQSFPPWKNLDLELVGFELPRELDLDEKWTIDHQSALLLRQITSIGDAPFTEVNRRKKKSSKFKVEPPLLPTDPELEQRSFTRARHSRKRNDQPGIPSETFWQDDGGAALYWPDPKLPETLIEQMKQEKLQIDKNDILFLQQCISSVYESKTQELEMPPHKKVGLVLFLKKTQSDKIRHRKSMRRQDIHHHSCRVHRRFNSVCQTRLSAVCL